MYDPTISTIAAVMHTEWIVQAAQDAVLAEAKRETAHVSRSAQVITRLRGAAGASSVAFKGYREAFATVLRELARRVEPSAR